MKHSCNVQTNRFVSHQTIHVSGQKLHVSFLFMNLIDDCYPTQPFFSPSYLSFLSRFPVSLALFRIATVSCLSSVDCNIHSKTSNRCSFLHYFVSLFHSRSLVRSIDRIRFVPLRLLSNNLCIYFAQHVRTYVHCSCGLFNY